MNLNVYLTPSSSSTREIIRIAIAEADLTLESVAKATHGGITTATLRKYLDNQIDIPTQTLDELLYVLDLAIAPRMSQDRLKRMRTIAKQHRQQNRAARKPGGKARRGDSLVEYARSTLRLAARQDHPDAIAAIAEKPQLLKPRAADAHA